MAHRNHRRRETSHALLNGHANNNLAVNDPSHTSAATAASAGSSKHPPQQAGRQRAGKSQGGSSSMENNLAFVLIGIVIMHIACHTLRVFLAGMAVHLIKDTVHCMRKEGGFVPPLWSMCAESVSSLLIMVNFSGNFLIYCSVLKPFKAAVSRLLHRWKKNYPHGIEMMNSNVSTNWGGAGAGATAGGMSRATPEPAGPVSKAGIFSKARTLIMRTGEGGGAAAAAGKEPVATFTSIVSMSSEKKRKMMACPKERTRAARITQSTFAHEASEQQCTAAADAAGSISVLVPTATALQQEEAVGTMLLSKGENESLLGSDKQQKNSEDEEANEVPESLTAVDERAASDTLSRESTNSCSSICERQSDERSSEMA